MLKAMLWLLYLQACRAAASDAANQAEHSKAAAESAAQAVLSCKKSVGDAAVSAEAQAQANKAGELQAHLTATAALQLGNDTPCLEDTSGLHSHAAVSHHRGSRT